jgi:hypothetical protein
MKFPAVALLVPLLLASLACEPEPFVDEPWTEESELDLTAGFRVYDEQTGMVSFLELQEGDPVVMERGFQGGQHIELMILTDAFEVFTDVEYQMQIREPGREGALLQEIVSMSGAFPAEDMGEASDKVFLTPRILLDDTSLVGEEIEVRVLLKDKDGKIGRVRVQGFVDLYDPFSGNEGDGGPPRLGGVG